MTEHRGDGGRETEQGLISRVHRPFGHLRVWENPRRGLRFAALAAAIGFPTFVPRHAHAFDAMLSWTRISRATGYNVYVRYESTAFVKGTGPDGSNVPDSLVALAIGAPASETQSIDGAFTTLVSGAVHYLVTGLPVGPKIFFTITSQDTSVSEESDHSNELSID